MTVETETVGAVIDVKVDETGRVSEAIEVATDASTNAVRVAGTTGIETTSEPSTTGPALNATTRTFLSGMHATAVKPHDPAAVANGTAPRAPEEVGNATTVVSKVVASKVGRKVAVNKVGRKVAVVTISAVGDRRNVVALPMVHFEGPRANGPAMHTTAHPGISERRAPLSERKTERT